MSERRFSETEVAAILERAAKAQSVEPQEQLSPASGMTLSQLQEIGSDVGISSDAIAQAARAIDQRKAIISRTFFGAPIGVSHVVELPRKLSDAEWEQVVSDLRATFDARGVVRQDGTTRFWGNGNLHVFLEPTSTAHRLRFRTIKGSSRPLLAVGTVAVLTAIFGTLFVSMRTGIDASFLRAMTMFAVMGVGMLSVALLQLPAWARIRRRQMEELAMRVNELTGQ